MRVHNAIELISKVIWLTFCELSLCSINNMISLISLNSVCKIFASSSHTVVFSRKVHAKWNLYKSIMTSFGICSWLRIWTLNAGEKYNRSRRHSGECPTTLGQKAIGESIKQAIWTRFPIFVMDFQCSAMKPFSSMSNDLVWSISKMADKYIRSNYILKTEKIDRKYFRSLWKEQSSAESFKKRSSIKLRSEPQEERFEKL